MFLDFYDHYISLDFSVPFYKVIKVIIGNYQIYTIEIWEKAEVLK